MWQTQANFSTLCVYLLIIRGTLWVDLTSATVLVPDGSVYHLCLPSGPYSVFVCTHTTLAPRKVISQSTSSQWTAHSSAVTLTVKFWPSSCRVQLTSSTCVQGVESLYNLVFLTTTQAGNIQQICS